MRRAPLLARICCVAVCGALAAACSSNKGGPGGPDGGPDAGPKPHPIPGPGQAAAWQIADDADLVGGPSTAGRKGDFTIANGRVRFVIEGAHASDGYDPHGC